jgi:hypothetical protein
MGEAFRKYVASRESGATKEQVAPQAPIEDVEPEDTESVVWRQWSKRHPEADPGKLATAATSALRGAYENLPEMLGHVLPGETPESMHKTKVRGAGFHPELAAASELAGGAAPYLLAPEIKAGGMISKAAAPIVQRAIPAAIGGVQGYGQGGVEGALTGAAGAALMSEAAKSKGLLGYAPDVAMIGRGVSEFASPKSSELEQARGIASAVFPVAARSASAIPASARGHEELAGIAKQQMLESPDVELGKSVKKKAGEIRGTEKLARAKQLEFEAETKRLQEAAKPIDESEATRSAEALWAQMTGEAHSRSGKLLEDIKAERIAPEEGDSQRIEKVRRFTAESLLRNDPAAVSGVLKMIDLVEKNNGNYAKAKEQWIKEQVQKSQSKNEQERINANELLNQRVAPDFMSIAEQEYAQGRKLSPEGMEKLRSYAEQQGGKTEGLTEEDLLSGAIRPSGELAEKRISAAVPGVERAIAAQANVKPGERSIVGQHLRDKLNPIEFAARGPIARFMRAQEPVGLKSFDAPKISRNLEELGKYAHPEAKAAKERKIAEAYRSGPLKKLPQPETTSAATAGLAGQVPIEVYNEIMRRREEERKKKGGK